MTLPAITVLFFVEYLSEDGRKRPKRGVGLTRLYITVSNYSAVVGMYMVTRLTAGNMDNCIIYWQSDIN
jgi:hypothetical protein